MELPHKTEVCVCGAECVAAKVAHPNLVKISGANESKWLYWYTYLQ